MDCDQAENWMVARENYLSSDDKGSLDSLGALMKKRDDLDKAITTQVITANIRIPIITLVIITEILHMYVAL